MNKFFKLFKMIEIIGKCLALLNVCFLLIFGTVFGIVFGIQSDNNEALMCIAGAALALWALILFRKWW